MRDGDALENNPEVTRSALEAIHSQVFGWALSRCNYDSTAAEDLVQSAYVELLSGKARFDGRSELRTFVFSVVQNLARSGYRQQANRLRLVRQHAETVDAAAPEQAADDMRDVWQAVRELPARQRDVIELVFCREMTIAEAAEVMGVSLGTGRAHYERAKKALKEALIEKSDDWL